MRGRAVHKNHNPTLYIYSVISPLPFFYIMDVCPGYILEVLKWLKWNLVCR